MTNREYINQMTDKELAQCMVDMGKLCEQCHSFDGRYCSDGRASCQERWLGKPYEKDTDFQKYMRKRRTYLDLIDILSNTFQELQDKFPDYEIVIGSYDRVSIKDIIFYTDKDADFHICSKLDDKE